MNYVLQVVVCVSLRALVRVLTCMNLIKEARKKKIINNSQWALCYRWNNGSQPQVKSLTLQQPLALYHSVNHHKYVWYVWSADVYVAYTQRCLCLCVCVFTTCLQHNKNKKIRNKYLFSYEQVPSAKYYSFIDEKLACRLRPVATVERRWVRVCKKINRIFVL